MANDDKVKNELDRTKQTFLRESPGMAAGPPKLYNVDEEFGKTRQNRSPVVVIVVLAFIIIFVGASAVLTYFIEKSSQQVPINISDFEDINLTDILDGQKRNENALQTARRELADILNEMESKIRSIEVDAERQSEMVANDDLTERTKNARIRVIGIDEERAIQAVRNEFDPKILEKEAEIDELQARIDAYDSRMIEQAKKSEELLNNQKQIFDLESQKITDFYEEQISELEAARNQERKELTQQKDDLVALLKRNHADEIARLFARYNPVFGEANVVRVLGRAVPEVETGITDLPPYRQILKSEGILAQSEFNEFRGRLSDFDTALTRMQQVPYKNSVPEALTKLRDLQSYLIYGYEVFWNELVNRIQEKNTEIDNRDNIIAERESTIGQFYFALESNLKTNRENGYILDSRNPQNIFIYIDQDLPVENGDKGYVFRSVDEFIGTITFAGTNGGTYAKLESLEDVEKPIMPFDMIMIQLQ
jgi:hypothetical protein